MAAPGLVAARARHAAGAGFRGSAAWALARRESLAARDRASEAQAAGPTPGGAMRFLEASATSWPPASEVDSCHVASPAPIFPSSRVASGAEPPSPTPRFLLGQALARPRPAAGGGADPRPQQIRQLGSWRAGGMSVGAQALWELRAISQLPARAMHSAPPSSAPPSTARLVLASAFAALAAGAALTTPVLAKQGTAKPIPEDVVLYQYEACPFCNKVKAYLDYYGIPYKVVEVNPLTRKEIKWSEYKKVPILVVDGEQMNDSSLIISTLQERLNPPTPAPRNKAAAKAAEESTAEEATWRKWVDDHLVHLLSPNIYRTPGEALEAFEYITTNGNFGTIERTMARYVGASTMYLIGKRLKKKHNIDDERKSLYAALDEWVQAVGARKFMGGDKPNLADLAVFGVLRPIRHMQTGREMMEHTGIGPWYSRMEGEVGASGRLPASASATPKEAAS